MTDEVDEIVAAWRRERPDLDVEPLQVLSRVSRLAAVLDERRARAFVEHDLRVTSSTCCPCCGAAGAVRADRRRAGRAHPCHLRHDDQPAGRAGAPRPGLAAPRPGGRPAGPGAPDRAGRRRVDAAFAALLDGERELLATLDDPTRARAGRRAAHAAAGDRVRWTDRSWRCAQYRDRNVDRTLRSRPVGTPSIADRTRGGPISAPDAARRAGSRVARPSRRSVASCGSRRSAGSGTPPRCPASATGSACSPRRRSRPTWPTGTRRRTTRSAACWSSGCCRRSCSARSPARSPTASTGAGRWSSRTSSASCCS